ncbi:MAG: class I SAM-dependent methyltransferase [Anaerolineae bacterium]
MAETRSDAAAGASDGGVGLDRVWQSPVLADRYLTRVRQRIPYGLDQLDVMMRVVRAAEKEVTSFLDLGCGDGILASLLLAAYPRAQAALVDFSAPMLAAAKARLGEYGEQVAYLPLDYGDPDWRRQLGGLAPFDAIVSGYSIHHQPDGRKRQLYGEILDLLRPGGTFVNVEHVASETAWVSHLSDELFIDTSYRALAGEGRTRAQVATEFYDRPDKAANLLTPVEVQCGWLRDLGFVDVSCYFKVFELAVFGGRKPGAVRQGAR